MHWEDTAAREAVNFAAALSVPDHPILFRVCILRVAEADSLPAALVEFWCRVLTEGAGACSDCWSVLLFQMNLIGGGFTCLFTNPDRGRDEPPVFKFSSEAIEAECDALPEDDPQAEEEYQAMEDRVLDMLRQAVRSATVADHLRRLSEAHGFKVQVCDFYRVKRWELGV
jgi:hypothetical protein